MTVLLCKSFRPIFGIWSEYVQNERSLYGRQVICSLNTLVYWSL